MKSRIHHAALRAGLLASLSACPTPARAAGDWLETLDKKLHLELADGWFTADLSGLADLELYYIDQTPPGFLVSSDDWLVNPRLALFLDTQFGPHFYSLVQVRFDRGFDPGVVPDGDARFDEYLLRYTPFDEPWLNVQAGKFATVFGNWVNRHDTWQNPFINAPALYEGLTIITDGKAPASPQQFLARRNVPDQVATWLPVVWGPAYTSGGSVFGSVEGFDYAFEFKNASISSHPYVWDAKHKDWEDPTVSGRVGYRPNATWNVGASFSHGGYFMEKAAPTLPAGSDLQDWDQTAVGVDVSFAWRHLQIWAEAIASEYEVPRVGDASTLGYYLEARYKITPKLYGALRWNQQFFDEVPDGAGGEERWDRDAWKAEAALGFRWTRHFQTKIQYGYCHQNWHFQQGEQTFALQATVKF